MAACVLDCSVTLAWFLPGERSSGTDALLDRVADAGAVVPALWPLEVANVLLMAERKRRIAPAQRVTALTALRRLPIRIDADTADHAWRNTFNLAVINGLTIYDAAYLELAVRTGLPLATLDQPLAEAARARGIDVRGR